MQQIRKPSLDHTRYYRYGLDKYVYKFVSLKPVRFWNLDTRLDMKSHLAVIDHNGRRLKISIDADDTSVYGFDWEIRWAIFHKLYEKQAQAKLANELLAANSKDETQGAGQ